MPFTDLTPPPLPPARTDDPETFITRADAFVAWQTQFADELIVFIAELETAAALIDAAPAYADPGLVALSGNTPAADSLPYYTGSSTSALATFTAAGRALLDDASASDMLTTLGVSAFAKTILDDADAAAVRGTIAAAASGANTDITSLAQAVTVAATGTIAASSIGFRGLPASGQAGGSGITLALDDAGKMVPNTTGGWTVPANGTIAFPVGTTIVLFNNSGSSQNVAITSDTLRLAGTSLTGTRAVLQRGLATLVKVASTEWVISGSVT